MKRKIIGISIVLIMLAILLNTFSFATVSSTTKGEITVTNVESGLTVYLYKLASVNISNGQPTDTPYSWDANVKSWIEENYSEFTDPEDFYNEFSSHIENGTDLTNADLAKFYNALASAIKSNDIAITSSASNTAGADETVTFSNLDMGTYLILVENGNYVYRATAGNLVPIANDEGEWNLTTPITVEMKRSSIGIEKTVNDVQVSTADTIGFTITTDIPSYSGVSSAPTYTIADELDEALILDSNSISVTGDKTGNLTTDQYTITYEYTDSSNSQVSKFVISLTNVGLLKDTKLTITYNCKLLSDSKTSILGVADATEGNTNEATLTYGNNTYSATTRTATSEVKVYTYGIEVTKAEVNTEKALPNAEFTLMTSTESGTELYFIKTDDGTYYRANSGDSGATTNLVCNSSGKLYLYGLDTGTYYLKETKAPNGYNLSTKVEKIVIEDSNKNGLLDTTTSGTTTDTTSGIYSLTFYNNANFQLPLTGGMGTVIFVAGGIVLIALGIVMLFVIKRKETR